MNSRPGSYVQRGERRGFLRFAAWAAVAVVLVTLVAAGTAQDVPFLLPQQDPLWAEGEGFTFSARFEPPQQAPGHPVEAVVEVECAPGNYILQGSLRVEPQAAPGLLGASDADALRVPPPQQAGDAEHLDAAFAVRLPLRLTESAPAGEHEVDLVLSYQGCTPRLCLPPAQHKLSAALSVLEPGAEPVADAGYREAFRERGLLVAIVMAYGGGLLLAFTPCVYPLILVTIGVIGATAEKRLGALLRSLIYVLGISITYAALGVVAASAGEAFGLVLQSPVIYLALAAILVVLAAATFGLFRLEMPATWSARLQMKVRGRWGMLGIFVLGLLSGVAVTACVAPVVSAALVYVFESGDRVQGFLILFAIGWGMGTPLVVIGTFSGVVKALPRSGRWQKAVQVVLGLVLLAGAGYFVHKSGILRGPSLPPGRWVTSHERALEMGREQHKPVLLYFWQEQCPYCDRLKASTLSDERILAEEEQFVCAALDATHWAREEWARMRRLYGVWGFPTIVFVTSEGAVLKEGRLEGYVTAERLLAAMRALR